MSNIDSNSEFLLFTLTKAADVCPALENRSRNLSQSYYQQLTGECSLSEARFNIEQKNRSNVNHSPFCPKNQIHNFETNVPSKLSTTLSLLGPKFLCEFYTPDSEDTLPIFELDPNCKAEGHTHTWEDTFELCFMNRDGNFTQAVNAVLNYVKSLSLPSLHSSAIPSEKSNTTSGTAVLPEKWDLYFYHPTKLAEYLSPHQELDIPRIETLASLSNSYTPSPDILWTVFFNQFSFGLDIPKEENIVCFLAFFYFFDQTPSQLIAKLCDIFSSANSTPLPRLLANVMVRCEGGPSRKKGSMILTRTVHSINFYLSGLKKNTESLSTAVLDGANTMAILNKINDKYDLVPISTFYNQSINENLNIQQEYPRWRTRKDYSFCDFPFFLNAATKSTILRVENMIQMRYELQNAFFKSMFIGPQSPFLELVIRRDFLIRDSIIQLQGKSSHDLRKQLRVRFVDEPGVDEGGVQKEFFHLMMKNIFKEEYGMFVITNNVRWFRYNASLDEGVLEEYELVGKLIGLAIYNAVFLDLHFPMVLYKKLAGEALYLKDLKEIDPDMARGLEQLATFEGDVYSTYDRNFEVEVLDLFGQRTLIELCPGGKHISLTDKNRSEYIRLCLDFFLQTSISAAFEAFKKGFETVTKSSSIKLFRPEELCQLLVGESKLDFRALQSKTQYDGGYTAETPIIISFWRFVHEMTFEDQKKLLFFVTGSFRAPIGGLSELTFVISRNGPDSNRLPTSHTCFNVLLLPEYSDDDKMKKLLFLAMENLEGFGLF